MSPGLVQVRRANRPYTATCSFSSSGRALPVFGHGNSRCLHIYRRTFNGLRGAFVARPPGADEPHELQAYHWVGKRLRQGREQRRFRYA